MAREPSNRIEPEISAPSWVQYLGAAFGCATLLALFGSAYLASGNHERFCNSFSLLAAAFAFGASLSAGFIGGAAAVSGTFGKKIKENALTYSAGGGVAVLILVFFAFHYFKDPNCDLRLTVNQQTDEIKALKGTINKFLTQMKIIKSGPLEIVLNTNEPQPLSEVLIQYYSRSTGDRKNAKVISDNIFEIDQSDLNDAAPGIFVTYDTSKLPDQRENQPPPTITIRRIDHGFDPLRIQLYLDFPRNSRVAKVLQ